MIPIGETKDGRADMTNFEMDLFDTQVYRRGDKDESNECCKNSIVKPACLPVTILALLLLMAFFVPMLNEEMGDSAVGSAKKYERTGKCTDECRQIEKVHKRHLSTFHAWMELLRLAQKTVDITALYWNLRDKTHYETSWQGKEIFGEIVETARRDVKIRIAQNSESVFGPLNDLKFLEKKGIVSVSTLNFTEIFGAGVLHTKLWIVDNQHFYLGSANMDWQSLTEVKEMGLMLVNCSCLAWELSKIFTIYWRVGQNHNRVPAAWPVYLRSKFNAQHPLEIHFGVEPSHTFVSHSPEQFNPKGREHDLSAITFCMSKANEFIRVSVMDYIPATIYSPKNDNVFWPPIDDALKAAAYRGVKVELLVSLWPHSHKKAVYFLRSLLEINAALPLTNSGRRGSISIKYFRVPVSPQQAVLEFARVNHNKFMVTDSCAWIGTSNWSGDYFTATAGVGIVIHKEVSSGSVVDQLNAVFCIGCLAFRTSFSVLLRPFSSANFGQGARDIGSRHNVSSRHSALLEKALAPFVPRTAKELAEYLAKNVLYHSVGDVLVVHKPYGVGSLGYVQKEFGIFPTTQYKFKDRMDLFNGVKKDDSVTLEDAIPYLKEIFHEPKLHFCTGLKRWVSGPVVLPCSEKAFKNIGHSLFQGESISHSNEHWTAQHMHRALAICISRPPRDEAAVDGYATFQDTSRANEYIFVPSVKIRRRARYGKFAVQGELFYRVLDSQCGLSLLDIHFSKFSRHFPRLILSHLGCPIFGDWIYEQRLLNVDGHPICAEPKDVWRAEAKKFEPSAFLNKIGIGSFGELRPPPPLFFAVYESTLPFFGTTKSERRRTNLVSRTPPPDHFMAMVDLLNFGPSVEKLLMSLELEELEESEIPPTDKSTKSSGETKF
ncbi:hypothetical protein niasHS_010835 [Heterodera schachtii]|uniref:PLD phosphodiesterase domain-containing protein n=1 Tax=Heterodera schachtii TaxID=97005 RepID=A0ABD2J3B9_HETSC